MFVSSFSYYEIALNYCLLELLKHELNPDLDLL